MFEAGREQLEGASSRATGGGSGSAQQLRSCELLPTSQPVMASKEDFQFADLQTWVADHIAGDFMKAHHLMVVEGQDDPSTDPHKSQLEARKLLIAISNCLDSCPKELRSLEEFRMVSSSLQLHLGTNYINTDEVAEGEKAFEACRNLLYADSSCQNRAAYLTIAVLNQLGLLWSGREEYSKALGFLKQATEVYRGCEDQPAPLTDKEWMGGQCKEEREREIALEDLHTHTLFYTAQVYGQLGEPKLSADYCRATLCRQLYTRHFDPIEWCFNAATIAQYYQNVGNLAQARHCLACCCVVLPMAHKELMDSGDDADEELMEKVRRTEADVSRCWVKYCLAVLQRSDELQNLEEESSEKINAEELYRFDPLVGKLEEDQVTCELVHDYPAARAVFLFGQKHVIQAQAFFTLESYASDNISLIQDHSQLFHRLSSFQSDGSMKCRMHKRRVDMLSSVLDEINQERFPVEAKRLSLELGEVFKEMSDIKIRQGGENPSPHAVSKINMLLQKGIAHYKHFVELYRDDQGKLPAPFDQREVTAILTAQLNRGRMLTALIASPQEKISNVRQALELYEWIVSYHASHKDDVEERFMESVLFCKEMLQLLPQKVEILRQQCH